MYRADKHYSRLEIAMKMHMNDESAKSGFAVRKELLDKLQC